MLISRTLYLLVTLTLAVSANSGDNLSLLSSLKNLFGFAASSAADHKVTTNNNEDIKQVRVRVVNRTMHDSNGYPINRPGLRRQEMMNSRAELTGDNLGPAQYSVNPFLFPRAQAPSGGDTCELIQLIGTGPYRIPRWYFNPATRRCELFYYSGCCGNANNFPTFQDCQVLCEVDPCEQTRDPGVGSLQQNKYFFNSVTKMCEQFAYFGSGGNRNNFQTREECAARCPENPNPCAYGRPATGGSGFLQCGFTGFGASCPSNFYCHVGARSLTTLCCPKGSSCKGERVYSSQHHSNHIRGESCTQPMQTGTGTDQLLRWYYDPLNQECRTFTYTGLQGNENNFLTREDCDAACFVNPCALGSPFRVGSQIQQCSALNPDVCPSGYFCHIGADQKTTCCCQRLGPSACTQTQLPGKGVNQLQRWTYNNDQRRCTAFTYSGIGGNENNFLTEDQCKQVCKVFTNVCGADQPLVDDSGFPRTCAPTALCPISFWCHIGVSTETTMCCPNAVIDVCNLPKATGDGFDGMYRWTFDSITKKCQPFTYAGRNGNQNNFLTRDDCVVACPEYQNPCQTSEPVLAPGPNNYRQPVICYPNEFTGQSTGCPQNAWCHIGATSDTTMCCPGAADPCRQSMNIGTGVSGVTRWYFDSTALQCKQFTYGGLKGNQNNFLTESQCRSTCPVFENPCAGGEPEPDYRGLPKTCNPFSGMCSNGFYCHLGASGESTVCCPTNGDRCQMPLATGTGELSLRRYYFDIRTRRCIDFLYLGSRGNANNFGSAELCEQNCPVFVNPCPQALNFGFQDSKQLGQPLPPSCSSASACTSGSWCHYGATPDTTVCCQGDSGPNRCQLPRNQGQGNSNLLRYTYDSNTRQCMQFSYGGLYGNANNFLTMSQCETACPTWINACPTGEPVMGVGSNRPQTCRQDQPCPRGYWCHVGATADTTMCCENQGGLSPCNMAQAFGQGDTSLQRWYYDSNSRSCQPFSYLGIKGNMNNFLSRSDCEATCPVWVNPCPSGQPILGQNDLPQNCDTRDQSSCPASYWCHPGGELATTTCCPGRTDACSIERAAGEGSLALQRWYFDSRARQCSQFTYRGLRGNQNNFVTREQCELTCPVFVSPCPTSSQGESVATIRRCSPNNPGGCPSNYWCHIGATTDNNVCCIITGNACLQSRTIGQGTAALQRWAFDSNTRQCTQFTYAGTKGNQNNFLSRQDCEQTCPVFRNPCASGQPYAAAGRPQQCSPQFPCPSGYWCHVGGTTDSTVCCPSDGNDPCQQPLEIGEGESVLPRFYFNSQSQICLPFTYRGYLGSQNNFLTDADCQLTCKPFTNPCLNGQPQQSANGQPQNCGFGNTCAPGFWCHNGADSETTVCCPGAGDPCDQRLVSGEGESQLQRWYYNANSRTCQIFTYRGLLGNQNSFLSETDCQQECPVYTNPCTTGAPLSGANGKPVFCTQQNRNTCGSSGWCHIGDARTVPTSTICCPGRNDPCSQPMNQGSGTSALPRYYYNQNTRQCVAFTYRGLFGNQNNFLSQADCEGSCEILENPCANGEPATGVQGPQFCSQNGPNCPSSFYCHVGAGRLTTLCCPIVSRQICQQPMNSGSGRDSLPRFYYDEGTKRCLPFTYSGMRGNQNNFLTQFDCESVCPVYENVCLTGEPVLNAEGRPRSCSFDGNECGFGFFCHIGSDSATTMCCRSALADENRCLLPKKEGEGTSNLIRWYADFTTNECRQLSYKGTKGNANNFVSLEKCKAMCPMDSGPCLAGRVKNPQFCSPTSQSCSFGFYCHFGGNPQDMICCPSEGNACQQPRLTGEGQSSLTRFFYDRATRTCQQFSYRGRKGNENNFMTLTDCESTCDVYPNPCVTGNPYRGNDNIPQQCNALTTASSCPTNYWCHVGADTPNTVCCPGDMNDACDLPQSRGTGNANLIRWYFNRNSRRCESFTYSGEKGNQNNFVSQELCGRQCRQVQNPCIGQPAITPSGQVVFCSRTNTDNCPVNFWCHIGATDETTLCCPGATNPCSVPLAPGAGNVQLPRWYYNADTNRCNRFTYNGMRGNQNNFESIDNCMNTCPVFENPCIGKVERQINKDPKKCSPLAPDACGFGYFCLVGDQTTSESSFCCEIMSDNRCNALKNFGEGRANLRRWAFNPAKDACEEFWYRGSKGNENNFLSMEECQDKCVPDINPCGENKEPFQRQGRNLLCRADFPLCPTGYFCHVGDSQKQTVCCPDSGRTSCELPRVLGIGKAILPRFYYDSQADECAPFDYRGMAGNQNNFQTLAECEKACPGYRGHCPHGKPMLTGVDQMQTCGIDTACPVGNVCHVSILNSQSVCCPNPSSFCPKPRDRGSCADSYTRYGYDNTTNTCVAFKYTGCGGNLNNFVSLQKCTEICCDQGF